MYRIIGTKILIVGPNGSGKTTLGRKLAEKTGFPFYELDFYSWQPNWVETDYDEFRKITDELTLLPEWIIDGNYARNQDITIPRADTIIWLDVTKVKSLYRTMKRSVNRIITQEPLWHNNRESWGRIFSKDSVQLFAWRSYKRKKVKYTMFMNEKFKNKNWIRLRNHNDEQKFWKSLK